MSKYLPYCIPIGFVLQAGQKCGQKRTARFKKRAVEERNVYDVEWLDTI
jgi:hypothetical protein